MFARNPKPAPLLSDKAPGQKLGAGCLVAFFSIFLVAGLFFFGLILLVPLWNSLRAANWRQVPCVVKSSRVVEHRGDSTTYSVEVVYDYTVDGQPYTSNRYDFTIGSSGGRDGKQAIVDQHPPGRLTQCLVNPDDPASAVISRELEPSTFLIGLLPLLFVAVGAGGIYFSLRATRRAKESKGKVDWMPALASGAAADATDPFALANLDQPASSVTLRPQSTPLRTLFVSIVICLVWNGLISIFITIAYKGWKEGNPEWFLMCFLIPFVLVGLGLVFFVLHSFLALFNPRPTLVLSADRTPLGDKLDVQWSFSGNTNSLTRLEIYLEGMENATYRRGTDTYTDHSTFAKISLMDSTSMFEMAQGRAELTIPADSMHSFRAGNNSIEWAIHLHGTLNWWPDVKATFPFLVLPQRRQPE